MLVKVKGQNQFNRDLIDITDKQEVWIYNQHQKVLQDMLLIGDNPPQQIPEPFLEVVSEEEALRRNVIAALWRKANAQSEKL